MLRAGQNLRKLTKGGFDPAIATLLEELGYDKKYNLLWAPAQAPRDWKSPKWKIKGKQLTIEKPMVFDVGGIGKGYWIDQVSAFLKENGLPFHLVDGGGDMMATSKRDGSGWNVALEWPGRPELAIGTIELRNQGLAASDVFRRRWKNWHHLISARTKEPIHDIVGLIAVAPSAFAADQCTSGLAFGPRPKFDQIAKHFAAEYLLVHENNTLTASSNWPGELFAVS